MDCYLPNFSGCAVSFMEKKMPLDKSGSKKSVGKNIKKEMKAGKSRQQSIAIALNVQRKAKGQPARKKK